MRFQLVVVVLVAASAGVSGKAALQPAGLRPQFDPDAQQSESQEQNVGQRRMSPSDPASPPPAYPDEALLRKIEGSVRLQVVVAKDGTVKSVTAGSGDPVLVAAAGNAVQQWRYEPKRRKGEPTEFTSQVTVNFTLGKVKRPWRRTGHQNYTVTVNPETPPPPPEPPPGVYRLGGA
jgi:TonB family protein